LAPEAQGKKIEIETEGKSRETKEIKMIEERKK